MNAIADGCTELRKKLDFDERVIREQQIANVRAIEKSVEWVWSTGLPAWLRGPASIFWITGKVASGKSTLVNYLAHHDQMSELLSSGAVKDWKIVRRFFYNPRAQPGILNNFEGLLRSLPFQLLGIGLEISRDVQIDAIKHTRITIGAIDSTHTLCVLLKSAISTRKQSLCLFLDGLDEYDDNSIDLLLFLRGLATEKAPFLKICCASHGVPVFEEFRKTNRVSGFKMQGRNYSGIRAFTLNRLQNILSTPPEGSSNSIVSLATELTAKAEGVFL